VCLKEYALGWTNSNGLDLTILSSVVAIVISKMCNALLGGAIYVLEISDAN